MIKKTTTSIAVNVIITQVPFAPSCDPHHTTLKMTPPLLLYREKKMPKPENKENYRYRYVNPEIIFAYL